MKLAWQDSAPRISTSRHRWWLQMLESKELQSYRAGLLPSLERPYHRTRAAHLIYKYPFSHCIIRKSQPRSCVSLVQGRLSKENLTLNRLPHSNILICNHQNRTSPETKIQACLHIKSSLLSLPFSLPRLHLQDKSAALSHNAQSSQRPKSIQEHRAVVKIIFRRSRLRQRC